MQLDLFQPNKPNLSPSIEGFKYIPNFISELEHENLLTLIDSMPWLNDLKRRVQHYGYKYDYQKRHIDASMKVKDLPIWMFEIAQRLKEDGLFDAISDQVIVNEYEPGQGIAPHIDCEPCFEATIASLSLGSSCIMDFFNKKSQKIHQEIILEPRSLIVLSGQARFQWLHGIKPKKTDIINGSKQLRQRRVSLTFRKVIL